jgi:endonuclease YncB( thermonuclease family)
MLVYFRGNFFVADYIVAKYCNQKTRIRLHGIYAPEAKKTCASGDKKWQCGWEATNALVNIVGKHWVTCSKRDVDRYRRVVAVCRAGPIDLMRGWLAMAGPLLTENTQWTM